MKNILLSSAAVLAFAGAATAGSDATSKINGDADFTYNDIDGFSFGVGLKWIGTATLNNGWTVDGSLDIDLRDDDAGSGSTAFDLGTISSSDFVLGLTNGTFTVKVGDVAPAQDITYSGTTNMGADGFNDEGDGGEDFVALFGAMFGGTTLYYSTLIDGAGDTSGNALGLTASLGGVDLTAAYQDYTDAPTAGDEIFGLSAATTLSGVDLKVAYADNSTTGATSTGISASVPFGMVTVGAFYSSESATDDNYGLSVDYVDNGLEINAFIHEGFDEDNQVQVQYTMGDLDIFAGTREDDGNWVGVIYNMGGGASLTASWADDTDGDDEVGQEDFEDGVTVSLGFAFAM